MAVSKWLMRKSFDEAAAKAEEIKIATRIKDAKNAGLFTQTQEKFRQEIGLHHSKSLQVAVHYASCSCTKKVRVSRASRARTWLIIKGN